MSKLPKISPPWFEGKIPENSYRALFKWGDPYQYKHPNRRLMGMLLDKFGMTEADFRQPLDLGLELIPQEIPVNLTAGQLADLNGIVGAENVKADPTSRIRASYGKGMIDLIRLRHKRVENLPDVVVCPRSTEDIEALVRWCDEQSLPLYIFGGGSSVTRGMEAVQGGITLDMSVHMQKVVSINETNQTITVQAGMWGPQLEEALNHAPERFGTRHRYTCGHFPQSFEYSSVGGWVVTRGAGQNSTYYGKIEDIVISQTYITPVGRLETPPYPRAAIGPDMDQVLMGGEGTFGVLAEVTLKIFRWTPQTSRRFSYIFRTWEDALAAAREVMQGEFGMPSVFRLSDPEETDVALVMYGVGGTPAETGLNLMGYKPMERCLLLGMTEGERGFAANVDRKIRRICTRHGAFDLSLIPVTKKWEEGRFRDPYMREDLQDYGILIDTLECAVTWEQMPKVHAEVRKFVKARPQTVCMTHLSHAYPQGGNLYFIFIARMDQIQEYLQLQYGILEAIRQSGAGMSHHHGIGKQTAPWFAEQAGPLTMGVIRTLKNYFDPNGIMNPGGTLGLDMSKEQREKRWTFEGK